MWQLDWNKLAEVLTYNAKQPMIFSSGLFLFLFLGFSLIYVLLQKKDTARILFVSLFIRGGDGYRLFPGRTYGCDGK